LRSNETARFPAFTAGEHGGESGAELRAAERPTVLAARRLDLDHLCTQIGEHARCERAGDQR